MALIVVSVLLLLGAVEPLGGGPGCIAAITAVPTGTIMSGQTMTFTDGTIISPVTRFVSRTWSFGDGGTETSTSSTRLSTTHVYVNNTGHTQRLTVRLTERTGANSCSASFNVDVSPQRL